MKASASMAVRVRGRGNSDAGADNAIDPTKNNLGVGGRDATVNLMGGFGTVTLGSVEAGNGIIGLASAGAPVIGQDNGVTLDAAGNVDLFQYTTPALIPGLTARFQIVDSIGDPGADGLQAASALQDATVVGVAYGAGPLAVNADFTSFGRNAAAATSTDSRTRLSASYDLGVAKLGAGFQTKETFAGLKDKQYMFGVSVPMGAITLGATYAKRDAAANADDATGFEVGANYAFSKRTNLQTAYQSQKKEGASAATSFRVRLMHSF
jgi:predicted porin